jgi:hypothetical protein
MEIAIITVFAGVVIISGGVYGYRFLQGRKKQGDELLHFQCPHCRRRLAYKSTQAGRHAMCPRCRKNIVFPAIAAKPKTPAKKR